MDKKSSEFHRQADAEIALWEEIEKELHPNSFIKYMSDEDIAREVELRFGIAASAVLAQFRREDSSMFPTPMLVMMAYNPEFFGG